VSAVTGFTDAWPVSCEDFSQWVVEDRFAGPRPSWESAGVEFVKDAAPYERRKLRMLNGAHSALAYFGLLAGKKYVHEAVADPELLARARAVMSEASETLEGPAKDTAQDYGRKLEKRFSNSGLQHELRQIAMDGSQKLPVRLLPPLKERLSRRLPSPGLEGALAAWAAFAVSEFKAGRVLQDPAHERLKNNCAGAASPAAMCTEVLRDHDIFGNFSEEQPEAYGRVAGQAARLARN
jgi:fructuronate reductase